jgi:steroid 5-alpha reductase family enzyme
VLLGDNGAMVGLILSMMILIGACAVTWVASLITRDYSWTDRLWSILPVVYAWVYAIADGLGSPRTILMAILVTVWGVRLTANFARKGGYRRGGEDYRWAYLRSKLPGWAFQVMNLLFIAVYQNILLWLITLPILWTNGPPPGPLTVWDWLLAVLFLAALAAETVADQQQWNFQQQKKASAGRDSTPGFRQTGMFAYSRHPAWFFEITQWWIVFFFAFVGLGRNLWAPQQFIPVILGAVLLTALFTGSVWITEKISRERYPEYLQYQARVSPLIPWFARHVPRSDRRPEVTRA